MEHGTWFGRWCLWDTKLPQWERLRKPLQGLKRREKLVLALFRGRWGYEPRELPGCSTPRQLIPLPGADFKNSSLHPLCSL